MHSRGPAFDGQTPSERNTANTLFKLTLIERKAPVGALFGDESDPPEWKAREHPCSTSQSETGFSIEGINLLALRTVVWIMICLLMFGV